MPTLAIAQKRLDFAKKAEEHYNALRTNIQLSGDNLKVLSISSVKPGEEIDNINKYCLGLCACRL